MRHLATTMRTIHIPRVWDKRSEVCTHYVDSESRTFIPESGAQIICIEPILAPYMMNGLKFKV